MYVDFLSVYNIITITKGNIQNCLQIALRKHFQQRLILSNKESSPHQSSMLNQQNGYTLHQPILNTLLKSFLPHIVRNEEWGRHLTQLSKVNNIFVVKQRRITKLSDSMNRCPICDKFIFQGNLFVLIIHMEVEHQPDTDRRYSNQNDDAMVVKKYQSTYDGLEIHLVKKSNFFQSSKKQTSSKKSEKLSNAQLQTQPSPKDFVISVQGSTFISSSLKQRNIMLLQGIFSKFSKRLQTISTERKHYHSYNVYRTITPQSEEQNSDEQRQQIVQRQLERLRINDFNDVSYWDKVLFLQWNNLVRAEKKELKVLYQSEQIISVLEKFCVLCKQKQIPKINLNMHLYTLWSVGKITDFDMLRVLNFYDSYQEEIPHLMQQQ